MAFSEALQKNLKQQVGLNVPDVKGNLNFLREVGQGSMRAYAGTGAGLVNFGRRIQSTLDPTRSFEDIQKESPSSALKPSGRIQQAIYGTADPISPESVGEELGIPKGSRFAAPVGFAMGAIDLIPGGKPAKQAVKAIAGFAPDIVEGILKTDSVRNISQFLRRSENLTEDVIKKIAPELKNVKTAEQFKGAVSSLKERGFITSVKEAFPESARVSRVAGQYISRSTDNLAITARNLISKDLATAERIALSGSDDVAVATASELMKKLGDDFAKATDDVTRAALADKQAEIANTIAPKLTDLGRSIQAASILGRATPEGQVRFAVREINKYNELNPTKQIPKLSGKNTQHILTEMGEIKTMTDGPAKAERLQKLQNFVQDLVPTPLMKKITTVWKAGLLTGLKTTGLNLGANTAHFGLEVLKDLPATLIDSVASLFTGKRTKAFTTSGVPGGIKEGFGKGVNYLKTGFDERNIGAKLDYHRISFGKGKVAKAFQIYTDSIFRFIGSQDQPFYYGALARSLHDQALAQGLNRGFKGKELRDYGHFLVENPTEEMIRVGTADALGTVFQNRTHLAKIGQFFREIPGLGEFLIPFNRTPSAVAMRILDYSPVGAVSTIIKNIGKGKFNQRQFSEGIARGMTGTAAAYIGYKLSEAGLVNLEYPDTERERELQISEGRLANTIKAGKNWITPIVFGPAGNLLLVGAHFERAMRGEGSPTGAFIKAGFGSAKSFMEQTFLTNVNAFSEAFNDPERYGDSLLGSLAGSFVPTIVSDVARSTDPKERRTQNEPKTDLIDLTYIGSRVKSRIPGLRQELEPDVDILGREREAKANPLETMINPLRPSKDTETPVTKELRRLFEAGYKVSPTLLGNKNGYDSLSPGENTVLWKRTGQRVNNGLSALYQLPVYENASDEEKSKAVERIVNDAKLITRAEVVITLLDGLQGEELRKTVISLSDGPNALLNNSVWKEVQKFR